MQAVKKINCILIRDDEGSILGKRDRILSSSPPVRRSPRKNATENLSGTPERGGVTTAIARKALKI